MVDNASRRGAANLGMPLMIVAFIVIGGFLYWLNLQAVEEQAVEITDTPVEETEDLTGATVVAAADLAQHQLAELKQARESMDSRWPAGSDPRGSGSSSPTGIRSSCPCPRR